MTADTEARLTEAQRRDLTALAERVEALQGPCRETDARVAVACGDIRMSNRSGNIAFFQEPVKQGDYAFLSGCVDGEEDAFRGLGLCLGVKHYTASLDAVVALIERELPAMQIEQITWEPVKGGRVFASIGNFGAGAAYQSFDGEGSAACRAVLAALIRAKGGGNGE